MTSPGSPLSEIGRDAVGIRNTFPVDWALLFGLATALALFAALRSVAERHVSEIDRLVEDYLSVKDRLEPIPAEELLGRLRDGSERYLDGNLDERMAYYACLIYLVVYLTREVGFDDSQAGTIAAFFAFFTWLIPSFMGALADKWGFRLALMMAYSFLTVGYLLLGLFPVKAVTFVSLIFIMVGLATVKPVITGTSTRTSSARLVL